MLYYVSGRLRQGSELACTHRCKTYLLVATSWDIAMRKTGIPITLCVGNKQDKLVVEPSKDELYQKLHVLKDP